MTHSESKSRTLPAKAIPPRPEISDSLRQRLAEITGSDKYRIHAEPRPPAFTPARAPPAPTRTLSRAFIPPRDKAATFKPTTSTNSTSGDRNPTFSSGSSATMRVREDLTNLVEEPAFDFNERHELKVDTNKTSLQSHSLPSSPHDTKGSAFVTPPKRTRKMSADHIGSTSTLGSQSSDDTLPRQKALAHAAEMDDTLPRQPKNVPGLPIPPAKDFSEADTIKVERKPSLASTVSVNASSVKDLERRVALLQTTLASTEERFRDAKQRHEKEMQEREIQHEAEMCNLQTTLTEMKDLLDKEREELEEQLESKQIEILQLEERTRAKMSMSDHQLELLEQKLKQTEQDAEERMLVLQERVQFLEGRLQRETSPATINAEEAQAQIDGLQAQVETAREEARQVVMQDLFQLEESLEKEQALTKDLQMKLEEQESTLKADMEKIVQEKAELLQKLSAYEEQISALEQESEEERLKAEQCTQDLNETKQELATAHLHAQEIQAEMERLSELTVDLESQLEMALNMQPQEQKASQTDAASSETTSREIQTEKVESEDMRDALCQTDPMEVDHESENESEVTETDGKVQFISNDEEVMEFIETMTSKLDMYRLEVERLKSLPSLEGQPRSEQPSGSVTSAEEIQFVESEQIKVLKEDLEKVTERELRMEREMNGLLQELDRLMMHNMEHETEKRKWMDEISALRTEITKLQERLHTQLEKNLGGAQNESSSAQRMREEFRRIVSDIRSEYDQVLSREMKARTTAESALIQIRRERDMQVYSKRTQSAQTLDSMTQNFSE